MPDSHLGDLPLTFSNFVISLAGSAMMYLGDTPHPISGTTEVNVPLAKNTIDVLVMLQEKTKGNLDEEEQAMLDTLVSELQSHMAAHKS